MTIVIRQDLDRMIATFLRGAQTPRGQRLRFVLLNSEFHCAAAYRLGQYADRLSDGSRVRGTVVRAAHRVWNRWITNIHHCDISRKATIGPGLLLMHRTGIVIGPATIGANVVIHQNVTIGQRVARGEQGLPQIGSRVWIGPGATISGAIRIGDDATISAGSVVSRDVPAGALVVGVPARVVAADYDNHGMVGPLAPV